MTTAEKLTVEPTLESRAATIQQNKALMVAALRGSSDKAVRWLDMYATHCRLAHECTGDPAFDALRQNARDAVDAIRADLLMLERRAGIAAQPGETPEPLALVGRRRA